MEALHMKEYRQIHEGFSECAEKYRPYSFIKVKLPLDAQSFQKETERKKRMHVNCIIPEFDFREKLPSVYGIQEAYSRIFEIASSQGMDAVFHLDCGFERLSVDGESNDSTEYAARNLVMRTYRCTDRESVSYTVHVGKLMSIVAYDGNTDIIDLRPCLSGRVLNWEAPSGKWDILEFSCISDEECGRINYLNYGTSLSYISQTAYELAGISPSDKPENLRAIKFSDVGFVGKNRRMWADDFNERFAELYGFDPSPYYPALYFDIGEDTRRLKAQFFDCRARMLADGFVKAANDFAEGLGVQCISGFISTKFSACSALTGDNMLLNARSPCALLEEAYLYGVDSVKITANAAYNFGSSPVYCDIFRNYDKIDLDIAYKDSMHAFARGANQLLIHSTSLEDVTQPVLLKLISHSEDVEDYFRFVTRLSSVLNAGIHVSDIAMVYPIYSVHSGVYFYDYKVEGFEYPDTKNTLDYMNVINSISFYSGHDLSILHPSVIAEHCDASDGYLRFRNGKNEERYSILVLPASDVISIKTLETAKKFFDCGGKIIATGVLPEHAIESTSKENYDDRVRKLVSEIFGHGASDANVMREYSENRNANGGIAYMLYFSLTAADGTNMVDSKLIRRALDSFKVPYDITIPEMPHYESTGALNTVYPIFKKLGLSSHLPNGGMINHIHKKRGDTDVYYISNTTSLKLNSPVILRGRMSIEEWNPHTGRIRRLAPSYFTEAFNGEPVTFTQFDIELEAAKSVIYIGTPL